VIRGGRLTPRGQYAALALAALAARAAFLAGGAAALGVDWRDLALRYDGHIYLQIAKTLPRLYVSERGAYLTTWLPLYPALIRLAGFLTGDLRTAALAVSAAAAAAAVVLFRRLAGRFSERPALAAVLFLFFPPMWLLTGSLAFVEPVFLCAVLAAVVAAVEDRPAWAAAAWAVAAMSQKSGFLVPVITLLIVWDRRRRLETRWLAALAAPALAQAALQGYLWFLYGDPLINLKTTRETFGGALFGFPFAAFARGIVEPSAFGGVWRRAAIALCGLAYLAAGAAGWRRGKAAERPLLIWLGVVLAFHFSLGGFWAFHALPRYLLMGAPAALLLALPLLPRGERGLLLAAPLVLLPYFVGLVELGQAESLLRRVWGPGYFEAASARLR
jgi:hypothetical protein